MLVVTVVYRDMRTGDSRQKTACMYLYVCQQSLQRHVHVQLWTYVSWHVACACTCIFIMQECFHVCVCPCVSVCACGREKHALTHCLYEWLSWSASKRSRWEVLIMRQLNSAPDSEICSETHKSLAVTALHPAKFKFSDLPELTAEPGQSSFGVSWLSWNYKAQAVTWPKYTKHGDAYLIYTLKNVLTQLLFQNKSPQMETDPIHLCSQKGGCAFIIR